MNDSLTLINTSPQNEVVNIITHSQYFNNIWFTYHKVKNNSKTNQQTVNKMDEILSIMLDFPDFCMNNRQNPKSVCKNCYAFIQSSIRGKSIWPKLKHNTRVFSNSEIGFNKFSTPLNILRFDSYGELSNVRQLLNMILIAKTNNHLYTALWTKRYRFIQKVSHIIPQNMICIWSASQVNCKVFTIPKGFHKSFYVYKNESTLEEAKVLAVSQGYKVINCQKQCKACLHCYKDVSHTIVMELLK